MQGKAGESSEAEGDPTALPTPAEREAEARFVSTAPTLKLLNHHPLLEDLLHEAFLKKDYLAQAPFPPALPGPILPADALRPAPGPPAPRSPPRAPALPRAAFPTAPLTTPAERPGPWGEPWGVTPGADPSPSPTVGSGSSPAAPSKVPTTPGTSPGGTGVSGDEEGTTTTSTITTTTVTTLQGPGERREGDWGGRGDTGLMWGSPCHQPRATERWRAPRAGWCPQSRPVPRMTAAWTAPTPSPSTLAMAWRSR